jgi:predicted nucleic acid-binding Zn ribbon protein
VERYATCQLFLGEPGPSEAVDEVTAKLVGDLLMTETSGERAQAPPPIYFWSSPQLAGLVRLSGSTASMHSVSRSSFFRVATVLSVRAERSNAGSNPAAPIGGRPRRTKRQGGVSWLQMS